MGVGFRQWVNPHHKQQQGTLKLRVVKVCDRAAGEARGEGGLPGTRPDGRRTRLRPTPRRCPPQVRPPVPPAAREPRRTGPGEDQDL